MKPDTDTDRRIMINRKFALVFAGLAVPAAFAGTVAATGTAGAATLSSAAQHVVVAPKTHTETIRVLVQAAEYRTEKVQVRPAQYRLVWNARLHRDVRELVQPAQFKVEKVLIRPAVYRWVTVTVPLA